jgi:oligoendopeptidase F
MDLTWNLDKIYTSFDSEKFKDDMKQLKKYIVYINELDIDNCKNDKESSYKIQEFLSINNEYKRLYIMLYSYAYLIVNADFENVEAINILDGIENKNSDITEAYVKFSRWLRNIKNLDEIIEGSSYLLGHKFYLKELLLKSEYLLSEKEEVIISKMQSTGSKAWQKLYMELIGTTTTDITINGIVEKLTLSDIRNIAYEKNALLRKTAYYSEVNLCKGISQVCCTCFL